MRLPLIIERKSNAVKKTVGAANAAFFAQAANGAVRAVSVRIEPQRFTAFANGAGRGLQLAAYTAAIWKYNARFFHMPNARSARRASASGKPTTL